MGWERDVCTLGLVERTDPLVLPKTGTCSTGPSDCIAEMKLGHWSLVILMRKVRTGILAQNEEKNLEVMSPHFLKIKQNKNSDVADQVKLIYVYFSFLSSGNCYTGI